MAIEGFVSAAGAAFQLETLHSISQVPIKGALDTHYHFDHSMETRCMGRREFRSRRTGDRQENLR